MNVCVSTNERAMLRSAGVALALAALTACGPNELTFEESIDGDGALEVAIGDDFGDAPDAPPVPELCTDADDCSDTPVEAPERTEAPEDVATNDTDDASSGQAEDALTSGSSEPVAGSKMITARYAAFRKSPSSSASRYDVAPHGGVPSSALHPYRNPRGVIPPGQKVTLIDTRTVNGYVKVRYDGATGWVYRSKLIWLDPRVSRLTLAKRPSVRNAFFKHQIRRPRWNKDGPLSSGNCAPTSLAMAVLVLGAEPRGLSVEQSIHRVRSRYESPLREREGTTRSEIQSAATQLGLHVRGLTTDVPPATGLQRLRDQLARGRVVVLNGMPGKANAGPTLYERAFTRAYARAIRNGASLRHSTYNYDGGHSILVLGRDSAGRYIVGDPISEIGFLAITPDEMKDFITRFRGNRGTGVAVWK